LKPTGPFLVVDSKPFKILDLVDENEKYYKEVEISYALQKAKEVSLDLVCFAEASNNTNALCKLVDFGRWKYQNDKKRKKNQKVQKHELKEIRFSPAISDHDVDHKIKHAREFIAHGHELNFTMRLRRRVSRDVAQSRMDDILKKCEDFATVTSRKNENNFISVRLTKKKE
jgi:translation initiation factor IF-3